MDEHCKDDARETDTDVGTDRSLSMEPGPDTLQDTMHTLLSCVGAMHQHRSEDLRRRDNTLGDLYEKQSPAREQGAPRSICDMDEKAGDGLPVRRAATGLWRFSFSPSSLSCTSWGLGLLRVACLLACLLAWRKAQCALRGWERSSCVFKIGRGARSQSGGSAEGVTGEIDKMGVAAYR